MIESIGALVRIPTFMTELFVNYDCEIDRGDLCADMVGLLSRNAFPDSATWSTTNVPPLCLDALLGYVQSVFDRLEDEPTTEALPTQDGLRRQRMLKGIIIRGSAKFNENPKAGLAFLASQGVIENVENPRHIAKFLQGTGRLDKKVLGDFISKPANSDILREFMDHFNFSELRVDEAIRKLLYTFRLPGESALIEQILAVFCEKYYSDGNHDNVANQDSIYILTYAIIMLNTDLHSPNVKPQKRMTIEQFGRQLRGVNDTKDFDLEYLTTIYNTIKSNEIILPEEHQTKDAYDHAWKELLVKIQGTPDQIICNTNIFDGDMFAATWRPIVATLSYVFMSASDDAVFSRVITGFHQCAQIAAKYGLRDALDRMIFCLSQISTLATGATPDTSLNTEVQANEKSVMVSEMAVKFGRDDRAQLATIVLFRVVAGNENTVGDGWDDVRFLMNFRSEGSRLTSSDHSNYAQFIRKLTDTVLFRHHQASSCSSSHSTAAASSGN
jgi:brefeldin A-resistance guanine nucleotide exchange factor 1